MPLYLSNSSLLLSGTQSLASTSACCCDTSDPLPTNGICCQFPSTYFRYIQSQITVTRNRQFFGCCQCVPTFSAPTVVAAPCSGQACSDNSYNVANLPWVFSSDPAAAATQRCNVSISQSRLPAGVGLFPFSAGTSSVASIDIAGCSLSYGDSWVIPCFSSVQRTTFSWSLVNSRAKLSGSFSQSRYLHYFAIDTQALSQQTVVTSFSSAQPATPSPGLQYNGYIVESVQLDF